jgi:hypothetical protein
MNSFLKLRKVNSPFTGDYADRMEHSVLNYIDTEENLVYLKGLIPYKGKISGTELILDKLNGGEIRVELDISKEQLKNGESEIKVDKYGRWIASPALASKHMILPNFTPKSTNDEMGMLGDAVWDDNYIYIKTNNGWKRSSLENF